jgi:hypothetical protein
MESEAQSSDAKCWAFKKSPPREHSIYTACREVKNDRMDLPSRDRPPGNMPMVSACRYLAGKAVSSVILLIGAAALIGWVAVELYVAMVTLD